MKPESEKRIVQVLLAIGCLVPIAAGGTAVFRGAAMLGGSSVDLDNHFRYLSGLLLGIGLAFASTIANIETKTTTVRVLTGLVVVGGIARAIGYIHAVPSPIMSAALVMELVLTPMLCLWQTRLARRFDAQA